MYLFPFSGWGMSFFAAPLPPPPKKKMGGKSVFWLQQEKFGQGVFKKFPFVLRNYNVTEKRQYIYNNTGDQYTIRLDSKLKSCGSWHFPYSPFSCLILLIFSAIAMAETVISLTFTTCILLWIQM